MLGITRKSWTQKLEEYRGRIVVAESELAALVQEREGLVVAMLDAEPAAVKRVSAIDAKGRTLNSHIADLQTAIQTAEREIAAEARELARREDVARAGRARKAVQAIFAADAEADAAMAALATALRRRREGARALQAALPDGQNATRLYLKRSTTAAACHFGLAEFLDIEHSSHRKPLAESDQYIQGYGKVAATETAVA